MITPNGGVFGRNPKFNTVTTQGGIVAGAASTLAGNLTVTGGNVVLSNGNGIDFSAAGNAAGMTSELLDDYEEGTWTPVYQPTSGAYTIGMDVVPNTCRYTKIGRMVHLTGTIRSDSFAVNTGTGFALVGGLPFTPSITSGTSQFAGAYITQAVNWTANRAPAALLASSTVAFLYIMYRATPDGSFSFLDAGDLLNGSNANQMTFVATYIVD